MKVWAFYGVKEKSFIGYTKDDDMKTFITHTRPNSFHVMKVDVKESKGFADDYEFGYYNLEANSNGECTVAMTRSENELYYWYAYIMMQDMKERMEDFLKYLFLINFDDNEKSSVYFMIKSVISHIDQSEYEFTEQTFYMGCNEIYISKLLSEKFFKYRREEDESLEAFQNYAMTRG